MTYSAESMKNGRTSVTIVEMDVDKCELIYGQPERRGAENLLTYSEQFDNADWTKTNLTTTADIFANPMGAQNAERLLEDTSSGTHKVHQSITNGANDVLMMSAYVKGGLGRDWCYLSLKGNRAFFNMSTGAKGTMGSSIESSKIEYVGNGWYRISASAILATGSGSFEIGVADSDNSVSHAGDEEKGFYLWGAQLTRSWVVRKYKKSEAAAVEAAATGCAARLTTSTNLMLHSEDLSNAAWSMIDVTLTSNSHPAPNGLGYADTIAKAGGLTYKRANQSVTVTNGENYTLSAYIKPKSGQQKATLRMIDSMSGAAVFDFSTGEVTLRAGASAAMTKVEGGWWRCHVVGTANADVSSRFGIYPGDEAVSDAAELYVWGVQLENQNKLTEYLATTTDAVSADSTGTAPCFNAREHCQDAESYDHLAEVYRFSDSINDLPAGIATLPAVRSINTAPTEIKTSSIGRRASVSVNMVDFAHHGRGIDPYASQRTIDAEAYGSFWGKFKARNPFIVDRVLRIKTGYIAESFDQTFIDDFTTRTFLIDRIDGPNANGAVTITAKDILKLADNERAQAPRAVEGVLDANITAVETTSITVNGGADGDYETGGGHIRINDELIEYGSAAFASGVWTLSTLTRAKYNTVADDHEQDDGVQPVVVYDQQAPVTIMNDLLRTYADLPAEFIPLADWEAEQATWFATTLMTAVLSEPTGVAQLLERMLEQIFSYMWWDERAQLIKFKAIAPIDRSAPKLSITDDGNIVEGSFRISDDESSRITRIGMYYNLTDVLDEGDKRNYRNLKLAIDTDAESAAQYGAQKQTELIAPWVISAGPANEVTGRTLQMFSRPPRVVDFELDAKDAGSLWTGDIVFINSRYIQDENGLPVSKAFIVTKASENVAGSLFSYTAQEFSLGARLGKIAPDSYAGLSYTDATEEQRNEAAFIAQDDGLMPNGDEGYKIA